MKSQTQIQTCYPNAVFSQPQCRLCVGQAQSHFSQFSHSNCMDRHVCTHTQTKHTITQSCTQNASRQADRDSKWLTVAHVCVSVGTERSVLCWLRSWQRPSDGSRQTSNKDCTVQPRKETDRGLMSVSQLSQTTILDVNWRTVCDLTHSDWTEHSLITPGWPMLVLMFIRMHI